MKGSEQQQRARSRLHKAEQSLLSWFNTIPSLAQNDLNNHLRTHHIPYELPHCEATTGTLCGSSYRMCRTFGSPDSGCTHSILRWVRCIIKGSFDPVKFDQTFGEIEKRCTLNVTVDSENHLKRCVV